MVWNIASSNGYESRKVRFDVLHYLYAGGLDLGCGAEKVWPHLIGVDSQIDATLYGTPVKPDLVLPDAADLRVFSDQSAENIFSSHLLEHLFDWPAALREWWRVLKTGGHLILYLPHPDLYPRIGQPGANPDHKHDLDPQAIIDAMRLRFLDWQLLENQVRDQGNEYSSLLVFRKMPAGHGQTEPWANPRPARKAGIVRMGGHGDALWSGSVAAYLHDAGYHVTVYCSDSGREMLRADPHIGEIRVVPQNILTDDESIEYWMHQAIGFDKWVNLHGSIEQRLLPHQSVLEFYLPQGVRHRLMNHNYVDMIHAYAELPEGSVTRQAFYPSPDETLWAKDARAKLRGPVVFLSPNGSGPSKAWPHAQRFMQIMADHGVYTLLCGDLGRMPEVDIVERDRIDYGLVVGMEWPIRHATTMALHCDAFVGTESVFANALAMTDITKVVMLSHSSRENLTRDWKNCATLEATSIACHPCHRIHNERAILCARDTATRASACMASYSAELVAEHVLRALGIDRQPLGSPAEALAA